MNLGQFDKKKLKSIENQLTDDSTAEDKEQFPEDGRGV